MNILHVNMSMDPETGGGTVERTVQIVKHMVNYENVSVRVLSTDYGLKNKPLPLPENILILLSCWIDRWYFPSLNLKKIYGVVQWADVIHLMNHWTVLNALVYLIARVTGKPYVVCPAGALEIYGRSTFIKKIYNACIGNRLIQDSDVLIAITEDEIQDYKNASSINKHIAYIPNGVDRTDYQGSDETLFREKFHLIDKLYILFMGRLNKIKGPDLLIKAFSQLSLEYPAIHLVFAGPDEGLKADLDKFVEQFNLNKRVHFVGYVGGDLKSSAYSGSLFLTVPSRKEAMSIVALEAAISGKPVLLTNVCGFPALAKSGGAIEVTSTSEGIFDGMKQMLSAEVDLSQMGQTARKFAEENYTWEKIVTLYCDCYARILS